MLLVLILTMLTLTQAVAEYYAVDADYAPFSEPIPNELAHIRLVKDYFKDGWDKLYIYASPSASPQQQQQAAGFLEGYATYL